MLLRAPPRGAAGGVSQTRSGPRFPPDSRSTRRSERCALRAHPYLSRRLGAADTRPGETGRCHGPLAQESASNPWLRPVVHLRQLWAEIIVGTGARSRVFGRFTAWLPWSARAVHRLCVDRET